MTDWIEHNGGPQPFPNNTVIEAAFIGQNTPDGFFGLGLLGNMEGAISTGTTFQGVLTFIEDVHLNDTYYYKTVNQHLIDAARLEGIRLGLEAAATAALLQSHSEPFDLKYIDAVWSVIRALNPDTIARETQHDS